jgi:hypothetical protein
VNDRDLKGSKVRMSQTAWPERLSQPSESYQGKDSISVISFHLFLEQTINVVIVTHSLKKGK